MSIFSGNVNKLVAAPMLQDFLIDKDGTPMSAGTVSCFHDNSRTTLKNWFYQTGTPGNYTYIALPNPLTLSGAGTICDANGVDTIPFFYPWSETDENVRDPYYITIVNHAQTNQITRANFPFVGPGTGGGTTVDTFNNLIINNGFWRNIAPNTLNVQPFTSVTYSSSNTAIPSGGTLYSAVVAPSQHDGFRMPDTTYQVTTLSATDTVTFIPFPLSSQQPIDGFIVPEYYLNHTCTNPGSGNSQKCYQFPISLHVNTLANVTFSFSIQAQNDPISGGTGNGANVINIFILQDTGTGGVVVPVGAPTFQYTLSTSWQTYTGTAVFPSTSGLVLGQGADDALYLQVQMPVGVNCSINFTKPSIYLTADEIIPNNEFQTYDQVDAIINSPRTGDIRTSLNSFYYFGWLPMNDGTIGNKQSSTSSNATARANADTWPLYNLIWNLCAPYSASGGGTTNPLAQMYNNSGVAVGYGPNISVPTTAYADFTANNQLSLSKMMGRVIMGTVPLNALLAATATLNGNSSVVTASNSGGSILLTTSTSNLLSLFTGATVTFKNTGGSLPANITANTVYYAVPITSTTFKISTSFANALAGTFVAFSTAGSGTTTAYSNLTSSQLGEYAHTLLLNEMANHTHNPLVGSGFWMNTTGQPQGPTGGAASAISEPTTGNITGYGSQSGLNVVQPATFYNIFIKL